MALYHVHLSWVGKGQVQGGALGFQRYLERQDLARDMHRYLEREDGRGKNDLVAHGHANLPAWAEGDAGRFWQAADRLERAKGPVFFHLQVALPRELTPAGREALAEDVREVTVGHLPHSWVIHAPLAHDASGSQPHVHIQFSSRREDEERHLTAQEWFKQAPRGVAKEAIWFDKRHLTAVRESIATLTNAALSREGHEVAVSHLSLKARDIDRPVVRYATRYHDAQVAVARAEREDLHHYYHPWEQARDYAAWQQQRTREHLHDLSRERVVDHVRDRLWQHDMSPARVEERAASRERAEEREQAFWRAVEREYARAVPVQERAPRHRQVGRALAGQRDLDEMGQGVRWREEERGLELGF